MAKITTLKEEFIVSEEQGESVAKYLSEKKEEQLRGGQSLNFYPLVFTHKEGTWTGSLADVRTITFSDKPRVKAEFKNKEDLERFHKEYGYGAFKEYFLAGYGVVDVKTQFLLKTRQAHFADSKLVMNATNQKWMDLWENYQNKYDMFEV